MSMKEIAAAGEQVRLQVLGPGFTQAAKSSLSDFNAPFDELALAFCWEGVWAREGLEKRIRSLVTLAILATLNRPSQIESHTRGALHNGCTIDEIREALMHVAAYVGIPAASDAFRIARKVIDETETDAKRVTTPP